MYVIDVECNMDLEPYFDKVARWLSLAHFSLIQVVKHSFGEGWVVRKNYLELKI